MRRIVAGDHHVVAGAPGQRDHRIAQTEADPARIGEREFATGRLFDPGQHHLAVDRHGHPGAVAGDLQFGDRARKA